MTTPAKAAQDIRCQFGANEVLCVGCCRYGGWGWWEREGEGSEAGQFIVVDGRK
jgi:hypothetical protein